MTKANCLAACLVAFQFASSAMCDEAFPIAQKPKSASDNWDRPRVAEPTPSSQSRSEDVRDAMVPTDSEIRALIAREVGKANPEPASPATASSGVDSTASRTTPLLPRPEDPKPSTSNNQPGPFDLSASGPDAWTPADAKPLDISGLIYRLAMTTGSLLAVAIVGLLFLKKWMKRHTPVVGAGKVLRLIESISLPNRSSLQLVQCEGRKILIGMNATGLTTIMPLAESFSDQLQDLAIDESPEHAQEEVADAEPRLRIATEAESSVEARAGNRHGDSPPEKMGWARAFQTSFGNIIAGQTKRRA